MKVIPGKEVCRLIVVALRSWDWAPAAVIASASSRRPTRVTVCVKQGQYFLVLEASLESVFKDLSGIKR